MATFDEFTSFSAPGEVDGTALLTRQADIFTATLHTLLTRHHIGSSLKMMKLEDVVDPHHDPAKTEALGDLLRRYGSDKSTIHNYHIFYASVLDQSKPIALLEIGMGTNNTAVPSNMGRAGRPGASLRAFRDFLPLGNVYGADVDRGILFEEDRIRTVFVDQLDGGTLDTLPARLGCTQFDVIIDDGLHAMGANTNTVVHLLPFLAPGGVLVVEDIQMIGERRCNGWDVVGRLLSLVPGIQAFWIRTRAAYMLVITKDK
jgi:hypothetical protein